MTQMLKLPDVSQITRLSRSSIYSFIQKGEFPAPVKIGNKAVAWLDHEIHAWIETRAQKRGGK